MSDESAGFSLDGHAILPFRGGLGVLQKPSTVRWLELDQGISGHLYVEFGLERLLAVQSGSALVETTGGRRWHLESAEHGDVSLGKETATPLTCLAGFTPEPGCYTAHGACVRLGSMLVGLDLLADSMSWKEPSRGEPACLPGPDGEHVAVGTRTGLKILTAETGACVDELELDGGIRELATDTSWTCWWVRRTDGALIRLRKPTGGPWIQERAGMATGLLVGCWERIAVQWAGSELQLATPNTEVTLAIGECDEVVLSGDVVAVRSGEHVRLLRLSAALSTSEKARLRQDG